MKGNYQTLTQLAEEIERQEKVKNDFLVPAPKLSMLPGGESFFVQDQGEFKLTSHAHDQVASKLKIPRKFYDRIGDVSMSMRGEISLRSQVVNGLFQDEAKPRLVRTLDGKARALLSPSYKPMDNYLMLAAVLPTLQWHPDLEVKSLSLSESRLYMQVVFPKISGEVGKGDVVQAGASIRNSEVGNGSFEIEEFVWRLVCLNGMIGQSLMRKVHLGRRIGSDEADYDVYRNDTMEAELEALKLKTRDIFASAISEAGFQKTLGKLRNAREDEVSKPQTLVENITKRYGLSDGDGESILANMAKGGEMNRYGLSNGITALAKAVDDIDRAYDFERLGNDIIELPRSEWEVLAS